MPKRKAALPALAGAGAAPPSPLHGGDSQSDDQAAATSPVAAAVAASASNVGPKRSKPAEKERLSYYDRKLSELEEERDQIKNGTHPELVEKLQVHRSKRDRQMQEAALLKSLRIKEVEALYDYQIKEATDVCASQEKEVIERMLGEIEENVKRAKELRDGTAADALKKRAGGEEGGKDSAGGEVEDDFVPSQGSVAATTTTTTTGNIISTRARPTTTRGGAGAGSTVVTKSGGEFSISFSAPADAIAADLSAIHSEWLAQAQKFLSQSELQDMNIRIEDGKLFYNELVFEKGSNVVVVSEANRLTFYGTVKSISPAEVFLKTSDGSVNRVLLTHLRSGRAKISLSTEEAAKPDA